MKEGEILAGVASEEKRMGGWRLETVLWTTFKFYFRWKVRNRVVSVGVSLEKAVLFFDGKVNGIFVD